MKCENAKIGGHCNNELDEVLHDLAYDLDLEKDEEEIKDIIKQMNLIKAEGFCCELCEEEYYKIINK